MDVLQKVAGGLGEMSLDERREIYRDIRKTLNVSETDPMLPLSKEELSAFCRALAGGLAVEMAKHPSTRAMSAVEVIEPLLLEYGQAADDAYLDSQVALGPALRQAGFSGFYIHAFLNGIAQRCARKAALSVLSPASAQVIEERYPTLMLLRHALMQEGFLGMSGMPATEA